MIRTTLLPLALTLVCGLIGLAVAGATDMQERDRKDVPERHKWDLTPLFPTEAAWREAKEKLEAQIPRIRQFEGKLAESGERLQEALETISDLGRQLGRLYVYASLLADQDTRESKDQAMTQEMTQLGLGVRRRGRVHGAGDPEDVDRDRIDGFVRRAPRARRRTAIYLDDILRRQPHTGTDGGGAAHRAGGRARDDALGHLRHLLRTPTSRTRRSR